MRFLLTGAAGFLGSHLLEKLLARGHEVVGLDDLNDYYDPARKERNFAEATRARPAELARRDIRDPAVDELFPRHRFHAVIHLAARAGVRPSIADPGLYFDVNVAGTVNLLEACRRHGVGRFVFASSSSVYGNAPTPFTEEGTVLSPLSPYGASKLAGEEVLAAYHKSHGLRATALRFFTAYGPRQRPDMAIHKFALAIAEGREVVLFGAGDTERDYTYVDDVVAACVAAAERDEPWGVYNVGGSRTVPLRHVIDTLSREIGKPAKVRHEPEHPADPKRTHASIEKARAALGFEPRVPFEEGVRRFVAWLRG